MEKQQESGVQQLKPKEKRSLQENIPQIEWHEAARRKPGEDLLKNLAVASSLVLCAIVLRSGALPQTNAATDAIMTAVTGDTLLDDSLGKLSFVSSLFPEATLVFGEHDDTALSVPVSGGMIVHAWSESEPYTTWRGNRAEVYASLEGEVIGVYHGENEERLVQIMGKDGMSCLYGNLESVHVTLGDAVRAGDVLGQLLPGHDCVFEVRRDGFSIDPTSMLSSAS